MKRIAVIDRNKCIREKCGYLCRQICPPVRMGIDAIIVNEEGWPVIDENLCTGCGLCPKKCPTNAIKVINLVGEAGEPLHQYGVNMFRIYNFAVPKAGSVTALVGRNGIGKTTLLDILSGKIIPNMFDLLSEPSYQSILTRTKNKVLMSYFERLMSGQRMSYKVQNVELLRKAAPNELVGDVINRFDERKVSAEIIKNLGMGKFLDSTILSLSGGELQKTAVAIAISKEADVYFFDEPSSYLDIYERVRVAREISRLAEEFGKQVIVVEHDLALLDYL
ncbi:MAG: ATP-binding cassette domain-containing protein, partial [Candidatus Micrarchaeia archaeon]